MCDGRLCSPAELQTVCVCVYDCYQMPTEDVTGYIPRMLHASFCHSCVQRNCAQPHLMPGKDSCPPSGICNRLLTSSPLFDNCGHASILHPQRRAETAAHFHSSHWRHLPVRHNRHGNLCGQSHALTLNSRSLQFALMRCHACRGPECPTRTFAKRPSITLNI